MKCFMPVRGLFGVPYQTLIFIDLQRINVYCVVVFFSIACNILVQ